MSHPGTKEWLEELEARNKAAVDWLAGNVVTALVIPAGVAKDLLPNGIDAASLQPIIAAILPGETVVAVDRSPDSIFAVLKG